MEITAPTIRLRTAGDRVVHLNPDETGSAKTKAKVRRGQRGKVKPHLEGHRYDGAWNYDRQAEENREMVHDRDSDRYVQRWRDPHTGEVIWEKSGYDSDPDMHGKDSYRPSGKRSGAKPPLLGILRTPETD